MSLLEQRKQALPHSIKQKCLSLRNSSVNYKQDFPEEISQASRDGLGKYETIMKLSSL
jgi:hypothetical protein